jgi:hypothetical protein
MFCIGNRFASSRSLAISQLLGENGASEIAKLFVPFLSNAKLSDSLHFFLCRLLDKLLVVCPNVDYCEEVLPRSDLEAHLANR